MVLRYTMLDTDWEGQKIVRPKVDGMQPKRKPLPLKKKIKFWLLLVANLIIYSLVLAFWIDEGKNHILELLTANRGMVSGIIYNADEPCAIVYGEVAHEGDMINGYKVVKIYKDKVELEKDGKSLVKAVH
ncbi:MAG: hypothetical protein AMJ43_09725 [Coxiella sp. DG_40]|nr:MAG: hypothetical protein AMJ43_09725 [Coxiella sp. DG_40]